ncbi:hypothetical protein VII_001904 [Vibrio mimicus MB451]|nr:hypothetical protein VII_001904 [Vibrio mimicus MB451]
MFKEAGYYSSPFYLYKVEIFTFISLAIMMTQKIILRVNHAIQNNTYDSSAFTLFTSHAYAGYC